MLELVSRQTSSFPIPVIASMALLALMGAQQAPQWTWAWATWLSLQVFMQFFRVSLFSKLRRDAGQSMGSRLRKAVRMNTANSVLHGLTFAFFPLFTPFQGAVQSMLFIGMGVGSITSAVGYRPIVLAHVISSLLPMTVMWAWSGLLGPGGTTALIVSIISLAYINTLLKVSDRIYQIFIDSFEARQKLTAALGQAEISGRAKTRFLAAASHDLRQPIHTLSLFSAALGMRDLDPRSTEIARNMDVAVSAMADQLDALLDISKLDAGVVSVDETSFDLSELLQQLREECHDRAASRDIEIQLHAPEVAMVSTDFTLLGRLLRNVLTNAVRHNSHCTVEVTVSPGQGCWHLRVADSGIGIVPEEQENVFEEFYQLDNPERDRDKGLGLGLAIVGRLEQLMGLDMKFESIPDHGTSFSFDIPVGDTSNSRAPIGPAAAVLNPLQVLVIDDEAAVREGMTTLLEAMGCMVATAYSTESALASAQEQRPDLALVDYRLRKDDSGLKAINCLRAKYPGLPAIMITADTAPHRLRQATESGVPVLIKPVLAETLKAAIIEVCKIQP